jgi:N-acetylmuramoyl-L-alanine amidase
MTPWELIKMVYYEMGAILVIALIITVGESAQFVSTVGENVIKVFKDKNADITIVIDAGHGEV